MRSDPVSRPAVFSASNGVPIAPQAHPVDLILRRAQIHLAMGRCPQAIGAYRAATGIDPRSLRAWVGLATALIACDRRAEAIDGIVGAAGVFAHRGDHRDALGLYSKALELDPARIEIHLDIAAVEEAMGKHGAALERVEGLAERYMSQGRTDEAAEILRFVATWGEGEAVSDAPGAASGGPPQPASALAVVAKSVAPHPSPGTTAVTTPTVPHPVSAAASVATPTVSHPVSAAASVVKPIAPNPASIVASVAKPIAPNPVSVAASAKSVERSSLAAPPAVPTGNPWVAPAPVHAAVISGETVIARNPLLSPAADKPATRKQKLAPEAPAPAATRFLDPAVPTMGTSEPDESAPPSKVITVVPEPVPSETEVTRVAAPRDIAPVAVSSQSPVASVASEDAADDMVTRIARAPLPPASPSSKPVVSPRPPPPPRPAGGAPAVVDRLRVRAGLVSSGCPRPAAIRRTESIAVRPLLSGPADRRDEDITVRYRKPVVLNAVI